MATLPEKNSSELHTSPPSSCLDPFEPNFDPEAALAASLSAVEKSLPSRRDRAAFRKAQPLDRIQQCSSVETLPFRPLVRRPREAAAPAGPPRARRVSTTAAAARGDAGREAELLPAMQRKFGKNGTPMAFLLQCFERRARVSVVMRRKNSVRGRVEGLLTAFDKHLNLVLTFATIRDDGEQPRRVRQLFIRGDNVVAVCG